LGGLLELGLGFGVTRVAVRVVLHGEASVGALDLLAVGVAFDAEDLVVVALGRHAVHSYAEVPGGRPWGKRLARIRDLLGNLALRYSFSSAGPAVRTMQLACAGVSAVSGLGTSAPSVASNSRPRSQDWRIDSSGPHAGRGLVRRGFMNQ